MKKKNKILSLAMVLIFAIAFLMPSLSMPATALAYPDVDSGYTDNGNLYVDTGDADNVEGDEATLWASVDVDEDDYDDDVYDIQEYGFFYGTDEDDVDEVEDLLADEDDSWNCDYEEGDDIDYDDGDEVYEFYLDLNNLDEDEETYYYRAYIEYYDSDEDEYYYSLGDVNEFDVDEGSSSDEPEVTTDAATNIDSDSAVLNGTIESYGDDNEITEYGFYYGTSSSPTTKKKVGDDSDNIDEGDDFDYNLTGLKADTKYYFKAYAKNSEGIAYGSVKSFTTKSGSVTTSPSIFTIGSSYYFLNGTYQAMDAAPYIKNSRTYMPIRYVAYAMGLTDAQIQWNAATQTVVLTKNGTTVILFIGSPTIFVNGVARTMDVAPEITNDRTCLPIAWVAAAFGATATWDPLARTVTIVGVSTSPVETGEVEVTTNSASSIGSDYATLRGTVADNGGLDITEYGFYYGTSRSEVSDGDDGDADVDEARGSESNFYLDLEDLDTDETYYFMAYAIDENDDITYGAVKSFTTKTDEVNVSTGSATDIGSDYATLKGAVTDDAGLDIVEFGFYYGTSKSEVADGEDGDADVEEADGRQSNFYLDVDGLDDYTTYYYMAYAIDEDDDISYGSVRSFRTSH